MAFMVAGECGKESGIQPVEVNHSRRRRLSPQQLDVIGVYEHGLRPFPPHFQPYVKYKEVSGRWSGGLRGLRISVVAIGWCSDLNKGKGIRPWACEWGFRLW